MYVIHDGNHQEVVDSKKNFFALGEPWELGSRLGGKTLSHKNSLARSIFLAMTSGRGFVGFFYKITFYYVYVLL